MVHLIAPARAFRDVGKSRIDVPEAMVQRIAEALWSVTKELYREGERRRKGGGRPCVSTGAQHKLKIKEAVFAMLPDAYTRGTNGERIPVYARDLFYEIRPLIEAYIDVDATLDFNYFSQSLLTLMFRQTGAAQLASDYPSGYRPGDETTRRYPDGLYQIRCVSA